MELGDKHAVRNVDDQRELDENKADADVDGKDLHHGCTNHQPAGTKLCHCCHHDGPMVLNP